MNEAIISEILKRRLSAVVQDPEHYAHKSFRSGMACTVLHNQGLLKGRVGGVFYADSIIEYVESVGRWTNSEWVIIGSCLLTPPIIPHLESEN